MKGEDLEYHYKLRARLEAAEREVEKLKDELERFHARFLSPPTEQVVKKKGTLTEGDEEALRLAKLLPAEFSVHELAEALHVSSAAIYQRLVRLKESGALVPTGRGKYKLAQ